MVGKKRNLKNPVKIFDKIFEFETTEHYFLHVMRRGHNYVTISLSDRFGQMLYVANDKELRFIFDNTDVYKRYLIGFKKVKLCSWDEDSIEIDHPTDINDKITSYMGESVSPMIFSYYDSKWIMGIFR